jgi:hypothetical protein
MKTQSDVIKFAFQPIDLAEISKILPPKYRGKYSDLKAQIVNRLNSLDSDKSFLFQAQGMSMKEAQRNSLIFGLNKYLNQEKLPWKVQWSEKDVNGKEVKAFVVCPKELRTTTYKPRTFQSVTTPEANKRFENLLHIIKKKWGVTLRQLQEKNAGEDTTDLKRALLYVGRTGLGIKLSHMQKELNIASSSATVFCKEATNKPKAQQFVEALKAALNNGG